MLVYATIGDVATCPLLVDITDTGNVTWLLAKASKLVRWATRAAVYDTQPSGLPVDDDLREALRDATAYQVAVWLHTGTHPDQVEAGVEQVVASRSMGGRSVSYRDNSADRVAAATGLCSDSYRILGDAGLLSGRPVAW